MDQAGSHRDSRMRSRERTRQRIVDATLALHREVGPKATTVSAVARRAGVQRLTVYRHFADERRLHEACSQRFTELVRPPRPSSWREFHGARRRMRAALRSLYAYYRAGCETLEKVLWDAEEMPVLRDTLAPFRGLVAGIVDDLAAHWPTGAGDARLLRAALAHATDFYAWRSLASRGLDDATIAELMIGFVDEASDMEPTAPPA